MAKTTLVAILISILLTSCISIKEISNSPTPQQNFVTATLAPTKINLIPTALIVSSETIAPIPVEISPTICADSAVLLRDVTIQDDTHMNAGEKFIKTWEFQNTGNCTWAGYTIKFSSGDVINAPLSTLIADTPPSGKVQASVELTAPTTDGQYTGYFTLHNSTGDVIPIGTQKTFWVRFVVGTYAAIPSVSVSNPIPSGNCVHSGNANYVSDIVSLINTARANVGLPALTANAQLATFAQHHAEDMAFNNFLSHDGTDGTFSERMRNSSIGMFSEILAIGTPQNAMEQWQRDEHWDFVLNAGATQIGVGYAYNSCSDYAGYFAVDFQ
jgi:uncharacterized protein YkwD